MSSRGGGGPSDRRKGFQRGLDADESRRKRETNIVELRKAKRDESLMKKRAVISGGMGAGFGGESSGLGGVPVTAGGAAGFPGIGGYDDVGTMEDSTRPGGGSKVNELNGEKRERRFRKRLSLFFSLVFISGASVHLGAVTGDKNERTRSRKSDKQGRNHNFCRRKKTSNDRPLFLLLLWLTASLSLLLSLSLAKPLALLSPSRSSR